MRDPRTVLISSDIHYAAPAEQARPQFELRAIEHPIIRWLVRMYRHYVWLRDPLAHNELLRYLLDFPDPVDAVVVNGDLSCDSGFVGLADPAALSSAQECVDRLKSRFGQRLLVTLGDHELGKKSLAGNRGGLRLASWKAATETLGLEPLWERRIGRYRMFGITSSLVALPIFETEALPDELREWRMLREAHLGAIRQAFNSVTEKERILLFLHDPTALPFLWREGAVREKLPQLERTIIGHLHTRLILWNSRILAGIPPVRGLGNAVRRMSLALNEARLWRPFRPLLCPSLAGIQLHRGGGFYSLVLEPEGHAPARFVLHRTIRTN